METKNTVLSKAIQSVKDSKAAFFKFIVANETGNTGSHQCGFYLCKEIAPLLFDVVPHKGENKKHEVRVNWQDAFTTDSVFTYYGQGTRNEYRMTRFGRYFPFLTDENIGNLFVLAQMDMDEYDAYVLDTEEDIEEFFAVFNLTTEDANKLIKKSNEELTESEQLQIAITKLLENNIDFPKTELMSQFARQIYHSIHSPSDLSILKNPDKFLCEWLDTETTIFKAFENRSFFNDQSKIATDLEVFISSANHYLNRRKARAGKSLEHQLSAMFIMNRLKFEEQAKTEGKKTPDFLFPDEKSYQNFEFPADELIMLGAKTTCKDRWRQVLKEANRIETKHLFTLQQGISLNQLKEMESENLQLVVPKTNISTFPKEFQPKLMTLANFIEFVKVKQHII